MPCPSTHHWYEMARGGVPREEADALRRHLGTCPDCRCQADELRDVAAGLERLAGATRADLPSSAAAGILRRARVHGYVGRRMKRPLTLRLQRSRAVRYAVPILVAAAAVIVAVIGLQLTTAPDVKPRGALERLARASNSLNCMADLPALAPVARAAAAEELARSDPALNQVSDLLLIAYIANRPRQDRQVEDVRFLVDGIWAHRRPLPATARLSAAVPMLATILPGETTMPSAIPADDSLTVRTADPVTVARSLVLSGDYVDALNALPADASPVLRAWCLESLGRQAEAADLLAKVKAGSDMPLAQVLRADLALAAQNVAEAMQQYESLAADRDRFWFAAGYLCRYELADAREAGLRFQRVRDPEVAPYVAKAFAMELAAVKDRPPAPLFAEDFEADTLGHWALVRTRGGEFHVVSITGGKALQQDEVNLRGAEWLTGDADWSDYTLRADVKILETKGDFAIGAAAYRRADRTGYIMELVPGRLRLTKQFAAGDERAKRPATGESLSVEPMQVQAHLDEPPAVGWWYTMKIRVQRVGEGVNVAGKFWRTDAGEPLGWQVVWTDIGQGGVAPLEGGAAGIQISGAKALIDNVVITRNEVADPVSVPTP